MTSLPLATFSLVKQPSDTQIARGFGAAVVLMVLVFVLFLAARILGGKGAGQLSRSGQRRAQANSKRRGARVSLRALDAPPDSGRNLVSYAESGPE
jgi:phosphate transport system permease protein